MEIKNKTTPNAENRSDLKFPFLLYPPSPPHCQQPQPQQDQQQQHNSQLYNMMSPHDYNSIFPVFPLMVEQNNPFPEFLDGFLPDLSSSLAEEVGVGLGLMENLPIFVQSLPPPPRSPPPPSPPPQLLQCGGPSVTKSARGKRKRSCRLSLLTTSFSSFMDPRDEHRPISDLWTGCP